MNEFDQYMKHVLKVTYYICYADDFVALSHDKRYLENLLGEISRFIVLNFKLTLHPDKVFIKTYSSGVDFFGWVHFSNHRVLRTATKKRMMRNIVQKQEKKEVADSYVGILNHGNGYLLQEKIKKYLTQL